MSHKYTTPSHYIYIYILLVFLFFDEGYLAMQTASPTNAKYPSSRKIIKHKKLLTTASKYLISTCGPCKNIYKSVCYKLLTQGSPANHVIYATRSANYNMHAHVKFPHVLSHIGTTNTCVALGTHEVAQSNNHLLDLSTKIVKCTGEK